MVQESLSRFLLAMREQKVRDPAAVGAFLNGICRNVVYEYRRRLLREDAMPEIIPIPPTSAFPARNSSR
jgi:DNA-directed RNA polymerase specialized sigma24 family protein